MFKRIMNEVHDDPRLLLLIPISILVMGIFYFGFTHEKQRDEGRKYCLSKCYPDGVDIATKEYCICDTTKRQVKRIDAPQ